MVGLRASAPGKQQSARITSSCVVVTAGKGLLFYQAGDLCLALRCLSCFAGFLKKQIQFRTVHKQVANHSLAGSTGPRAATSSPACLTAGMNNAISDKYSPVFLKVKAGYRDNAAQLMLSCSQPPGPSLITAVWRGGVSLLRSKFSLPVFPFSSRQPPPLTRTSLGPTPTSYCAETELFLEPH